jgi:hypothetical protein
MENYPISYDGSGCHILHRHNMKQDHDAGGNRYQKCDDDHPARQYRFLALLDINCDYTIDIGIKDEAGLLQFFTLVRPMLLMQGDKRFHNGDQSENLWESGASWKRHMREVVASHQRYKQAKKAQP